MVIVEGPDGSGKSTLVKKLEEQLHLPLAPRFADSVEGPTTDLYRKTYGDFREWDNRSDPWIYDRHPMISEYIYGTAIRGDVMPGFAHPSAIALRKRIAQQSLVILCLPAFGVVQQNLREGSAPQMPGVVDNTMRIYRMYQHLAQEWSGWLVHYNYLSNERPDNYPTVLRACRLHIAEWRKAQ